MKNKLNTTIEYYTKKQQEIISIVNNSNNLKVDDIIKFGEEIAVIEYKLTALEVVKEN